MTLPPSPHAYNAAVVSSSPPEFPPTSSPSQSPTSGNATTAEASTPISTSTSTADTIAADTGRTDAATSNATYTRHNAPKRSNFKPRWHTQPYMVFLALRSMPNHTAARQELINAAVALDRKFSAEKGLPRVFTGKTPQNSASACLTNNGDKYFIPFKPEGSRSTHFRLAYAPGDFDTAVKEYDRWMEKLIKHDWPLCFGVPKEGALPIHILEKQEQERMARLEQENAFQTTTATTMITTETVTSAAGSDDPVSATAPLTTVTTAPTATVSTPATIAATDACFDSAPAEGASATTIASHSTEEGGDSTFANGEHVGDSKKRSPEPFDDGSVADARNSKKIKAELDSEETSIMSAGMLSTLELEQQKGPESKVTDKLAQLELKSNSSATSSIPSTPVTTLAPEPESGLAVNFSASTSISATSSPSATGASSKSAKPATPQPASEKVDEYRLEDLDLTQVPTCLADIVRVDKSTIPNSGNGLFAKINLPASTPLGFYFGVPMTENEFDSLKDGVGVASHYSIMYRRTVLDATDENGMPYSDPKGRLYCPFHFMNEDPSGNITFITGSVVNQVICQTVRDVKAGEELFVFYGKEVDRFWEKENEALNSSDAGATEPKTGRARSQSRAPSPIRREDPTTDRPRRNNIYKPARYTR
ncbi:hypothetical protein BGZ98_009741 [Dissophora globulifera]|nr:hypothetical protein BGZ98_009741 [Dissophora globulifera]